MADDVTTEESTEASTDTGTTVETEANTEVAGDKGEGSTGEGDWFLSDGVKGEGEKPEWYDPKYKSVSEQAKGYKELSKKLGAFTGAPDEYEVRVSDSAKERGFELDPDSLLLESAVEFAKEKGMNQEGFDGLMRLYELEKISEKEMGEKFVDSQMKELGDRAQIRIAELQKWGSGNLPPEMVEGFESMFKTAANIEAMEEIIRQSSGAQTSPSNVASVAGYTKADVTKLQFEKDEFGNRAIETDPDKRKEYYRVRDLVHGTQAHREQVG